MATVEELRRRMCQLRYRSIMAECNLRQDILVTETELAIALDAESRAVNDAGVGGLQAAVAELSSRDNMAKLAFAGASAPMDFAAAERQVAEGLAWIEVQLKKRWPGKIVYVQAQTPGEWWVSIDSVISDSFLSRLMDAVVTVERRLIAKGQKPVQP